MWRSSFAQATLMLVLLVRNKAGHCDEHPDANEW